MILRSGVGLQMETLLPKLRMRVLFLTMGRIPITFLTIGRWSWIDYGGEGMSIFLGIETGQMRRFFTMLSVWWWICRELMSSSWWFRILELLLMGWLRFCNEDHRLLELSKLIVMEQFVQRIARLLVVGFSVTVMANSSWGLLVHFGDVWGGYGEVFKYFEWLAFGMSRVLGN